MDFTIKQGDTKTVLKATLYNSMGTEVDLTGANVKFILSERLSSSRLLEKNAIVVNAKGGIVHVEFTKEDLNNINGIFKGELKVISSDGKIETFPNNNYIKVYVVKSL